MITRSMEQLIIPQPSVPHRTTQERGHSTKRPASVANSHQNYFSTVGNLATKDLEVLTSPHLPLPFTITQSISTTTPSVAQQQFSNLSVPPQSTSIHVPSSTTQSVTFWELPAFLSQSTIGGCQGSNACTVISLLLAKTYLTNKSFLQLKNHQPLTPSWMSCMMGRSQVYDSFMQSLSYLGVVEAIPLVRSSLGSLSYEEELTVCFVKETNSSEESALSFHLVKDLPTQMLLLQ